MDQLRDIAGEVSYARDETSTSLGQPKKLHSRTIVLVCLQAGRLVFANSYSPMFILYCTCSETIGSFHSGEDQSTKPDFVAIKIMPSLRQ